jgi:hypothetical protein
MTGNIAWRSQATQSSVNGTFWSSKAIDDNKNGYSFLGYACSMKIYDTQPWWGCDLMKRVIMAGGIITNRQDCCGKC